MDETIGLSGRCAGNSAAPVDQHRDAAEIRRPAMLTATPGSSALLEIGSWHAKEQILNASGQQLID
jgi:hypothetical protein